MARSFFVVSSFIIGGWITGTSAIYEYAATAIEPSSCGASFEVRNIAVGPSAPPMMETAADEPASRPVAECECVYLLQKIYLHIFHQVIGG